MLVGRRGPLTWPREQSGAAGRAGQPQLTLRTAARPAEAKHARRMRTVDLNLLDELFLSLHSDQEPWGVHFEVGLTGRVAPDHLMRAIRAAANRHPIARARLVPASRSDLGHRWEIPDELDPVPLTIVLCRDAGSLAAARESLFGTTPSLQDGPPFTVLLAVGPAGDTIMLNLHHAAGDGTSAMRLMFSILRAYAGEDDPVPAIDPLAVRDVRVLAGAASSHDRFLRAQALRRDIEVRTAAPTTRVARDGGDGRSGYGFELVALSAAETAAVLERREPPATVNDVLLAALAIAVKRWNAGHRRDSGRIGLTMPVNLRPPAWRDEVVANLATYTTVSLGVGAQTDLTGAVSATAERTRRLKQDRLAGLVVDLLAGPSLLTVGAKRRLPRLISLTGNFVVDTATLSNLGRVGAAPAPGNGAGAVAAAWFSPPMNMPLGAAIGAVTLDDRLHLALRYRHPQFGPAAAGAFMALYRDVLLS